MSQALENARPDSVIAIPDPRQTPIPAGWWDTFCRPAIEAAESWDELDEAEGKLRAFVSYIEAMDGDALEFEKALRVVEKRRGELLGPAQHGGDRRSVQVPRVELDASPATANRWRTIAASWDRLYPYLQEQTDRAHVTQAQLLRLANGAHVSHNSGHVEWYTPPEFVEAARKVMGGIDLDPASCPEANKVVQADKFFGEAENGLEQEWTGRVWMNPPYAAGLNDKFCTKLRDSYIADTVSEAVVLVNNATETAWFQTLARVANALCLPSGRISFWRPDRESLSPLQGQAFLYLGANIDAFRAEFGRFGVVFP